LIQKLKINDVGMLEDPTALPWQTEGKGVVGIIDASMISKTISDATNL
jgi:hypothetical protein